MLSLSRSFCEKPTSRLRLQIIAHWLVSTVAICCLPIAESAAESPDTATQVAKLLETGWKPSVSNYAAAQEQFSQAKHDAPNDVRVDYAMALVALQNHNSADALTPLQQALQSGKSLLPIRRVHVWVLIGRRETPAAKVAIAELARVLKAESSSTIQADSEETARWLGSVIGYYAGPGSDQLKPEELAALDSEVSSGLNEDLATRYSDAKASVATHFNELQEQLTEARKSVQADNESKLAIDRNQTEAALNIATNKKTAAAALVEQLQQKINAETPALKLEGLQLSRQWDRSDDHLQNLQSRLDLEKRRAEKDRDSSTISQLNREIDQEKDRVRQNRQPLEKRMTAIRNQLRENDRHLAAAQEEFRTFDKQEQTLTVKSKQLAKQAEKPASGSDPKTVSLELKVKSISTYAGINLAREKQRILDTYHPKSSAP